MEGAHGGSYVDLNDDSRAVVGARDGLVRMIPMVAYPRGSR
jgi:hypothetical protein